MDTVTASAIRPRPSSYCFCPHCGDVLTKKVYKTHRRLYYDDDTQQWIKKRRPDTDFLADDIDLDLETPDSRPNESSLNNRRDDCPPIVDFDDVFEPLSDLCGEGPSEGKLYNF